MLNLQNHIIYNWGKKLKVVKQHKKIPMKNSDLNNKILKNFRVKNKTSNKLSEH